MAVLAARGGGGGGGVGVQQPFSCTTAGLPWRFRSPANIESSPWLVKSFCRGESEPTTRATVRRGQFLFQGARLGRLLFAGQERNWFDNFLSFHDNRDRRRGAGGGDGWGKRSGRHHQANP
ncbi:hypothetical protein XA68_17157 [Ophiocordyceps unilateralis]|uniref:Uncharacterized protein n=1 Tax=Ophiocordyceps unilateralis TaxID=268505 RepID=A0A2A9PKU7_OPHUN|nr:hypothetical protein XA68_17157 [Ophiocordyceps unilateralis]